MKVTSWFGAAVLVAASLVQVSTTSSAGAQAAEEERQSSLVEDYAYPGAEQILAQHDLTVFSGDGHIQFVTARTLEEGQCDTGQVQVERFRTEPPYLTFYCFRTLGTQGFLTLDVPNTYGMRGGEQPIRATAELPDGSQGIVDVPPDRYVPVFPGSGNEVPQARLVELRLTGDGPPAADLDTFAARIDIGAGWRSCSGALVAPQWVVTAASCFAEGGQTLTRGRPSRPTTATVGRTDLASGAGQSAAVVELVPRTDRDLVLAQLDQPVSGVTPVRIATTSPSPGEVLHIAGYGRTASDWTHDRLNSAEFEVGSGAATTFAISPILPGQHSTCKGDAGGPAFRYRDGTAELVGIHSTSWRGGCLGETETRGEATEVRVDDIGSWISQTTLGLSP